MSRVSAGGVSFALGNRFQTARGERGQTEALLARHVRVRVKRDVGDRVGVGDEEEALAQMLLHDRQRLDALPALPGQSKHAGNLPRRSGATYHFPDLVVEDTDVYDVASARSRRTRTA